MIVSFGERPKRHWLPDVQSKQGGDEIRQEQNEKRGYCTRTPLCTQIAALADPGQGIGQGCSNSINVESANTLYTNKAQLNQPDKLEVTQMLSFHIQHPLCRNS